MPSSPRIRDILDHIDVGALRDLATHQLANGHSEDEVIADVVASIDAVVDWSWVPYVGPVVEMLDGPIAKFIATSIVRGIAHKKARHGG